MIECVGVGVGGGLWAEDRGYNGWGGADGWGHLSDQPSRDEPSPQRGVGHDGDAELAAGGEEIGARGALDVERPGVILDLHGRDGVHSVPAPEGGGRALGEAYVLDLALSVGVGEGGRRKLMSVWRYCMQSYSWTMVEVRRWDEEESKSTAGWTSTSSRRTRKGRTRKGRMTRETGKQNSEATHIPLQLHQRAHGLLDGRPPVEAVHVEQVDGLDAEAAQAPLA